VAASTAEWSSVDRALGASMLDVLWDVVSYERLVVDWDLDGQGQLLWNVGLAHFDSLEFDVRFRLTFAFCMGASRHDLGRSLRGTCEGTAMWCLDAEPNR